MAAWSLHDGVHMVGISRAGGADPVGVGTDGALRQAVILDPDGHAVPADGGSPGPLPGQLVLVGGGGLNGGVSTGGDGINFVNAMLSILALLLIAYLAVKIPEKLNPEVSGIFGGFAQMLQMAEAGIAIAGAAVTSTAWRTVHPHVLPVCHDD